MTRADNHSRSAAWVSEDGGVLAAHVPPRTPGEVGAVEDCEESQVVVVVVGDGDGFDVCDDVGCASASSALEAVRLSSLLPLLLLLVQVAAPSRASSPPSPST